MTKFNETSYFTGVTQSASYFLHSSEINYITFPPNISYIGDNGLRACTKLRGVEIGSKVTSIGGCFCFQSPNIEWVRCLATTPPTQQAFGGQYSFYPKSISNSSYYKLRLYVPDESVETYKAAEYWNGFASRTFPLSQFEDDAEQYGWEGYE